MDFAEKIQALAEKVKKLLIRPATEEATKNAFIMPFIRALGYDVFDPSEVIPEFTADIANRKGEKVDYAIMHDGKPIILIECKCCGAVLDGANCVQLQRYFMTVEARIGILTDGIRYLFYSDLEEPKKMDDKPFMEIDLNAVDPTLLPELRKLCKGKFDLQTALDTASELKFNRAIKQTLTKQINAPDRDFVTFFFKEVCPGKVARPHLIEAFEPIVKRSFVEFIDEQLNSRLKSAITIPIVNNVELAESLTVKDENKIATTEEEWQAFYLIKSLLMGEVDIHRIAIRDAATYCSVLLDDNNRKPVIRLWFNNVKRLRIELFDTEACKYDIETLEDIMQYKHRIIATVKAYDSKNKIEE